MNPTEPPKSPVTQLQEIISQSKKTYNKGGSGEFIQLDETELMTRLVIFISRREHLAFDLGLEKGLQSAGKPAISKGK